MKNLLIICFLLLSSASFAQDTLSQQNGELINQTMVQTGDEPVYFTFENTEYKFIPSQLGYHIMVMENGVEVDYGNLMLTTDDGYYAMTSDLNDHVSYGRFDNNGNFKALRYDETEDLVIEENFIRSSKKDE